MHHIIKCYLRLNFLKICIYISATQKVLIINYISSKYRKKYIIKILGGSHDQEPSEKTEETPKEDIKPVHEEPESSEPKESEEKEKKKNDTKVDENKASNKTEKADQEKKSTIIQIKEPINSNEIKLGSQILSGKKLTESREK